MEKQLCLTLRVCVGQDTRRSILAAIAGASGRSPTSALLAGAGEQGALAEVAHLGRRCLGSRRVLRWCLQLMTAGAASRVAQLFGSVQFLADLSGRDEEHRGEGKGVHASCFSVALWSPALLASKKEQCLRVELMN